MSLHPAPYNEFTRLFVRDDADDINSNYGPYLARVIWALTALSAIFLVLRIFCKLWRGRKLWWDDFLTIAAWVCLLSKTFSLTNQP